MHIRLQKIHLSTCIGTTIATDAIGRTLMSRKPRCGVDQIECTRNFSHLCVFCVSFSQLLFNFRFMLCYRFWRIKMNIFIGMHRCSNSCSKAVSIVCSALTEGAIDNISSAYKIYWHIYRGQIAACTGGFNFIHNTVNRHSKKECRMHSTLTNRSK